MIYYVVGEESLVKKKIKEILEEEGITSSFSSYNLEEDSIKEALIDLNTYNLFASKKAVIVYNLLKIDDEQALEKYLSNPSENVLILIDYTTDERRKIVKEVKKNSKVVTVSDKDLDSYIKKEVKIDPLALELLKEYCHNNYFRIKNELAKLKELNLSKITKKDIENNVERNLEDNVFELINAIKSHRKKEIFQVYEDLKKNRVEDLQLLALLASHLRLLYKVKLLVLAGYKEEYIKDQLKIHPYRAKLFKEESYNYTKEELNDFITGLAKLDIDIKSGRLEASLGMKIFLSKFVKN